MSNDRHEMRRREDRMVYSSRLLLPYLFLVLGIVLALHFFQNETKARIVAHNHDVIALRNEITARSNQNQQRIDDLQKVARQQAHLIRRINMINRRQDTLIRQLQQKFPGEFQQPHSSQQPVSQPNISGRQPHRSTATKPTTTRRSPKRSKPVSNKCQIDVVCLVLPVL